MNVKPTGRVRGNEIIIERMSDASNEDVWKGVTESEHTAKWFGVRRGELGPLSAIFFAFQIEVSQLLLINRAQLAVFVAGAPFKWPE